jgi:hypothetical protein
MLPDIVRLAGRRLEVIVWGKLSRVMEMGSRFHLTLQALELDSYRGWSCYRSARAATFAFSAQV